MKKMIQLIYIDIKTNLLYIYKDEPKSTRIQPALEAKPSRSV